MGGLIFIIPTVVATLALIFTNKISYTSNLGIVFSQPHKRVVTNAIKIIFFFIYFLFLTVPIISNLLINDNNFYFKIVQLIINKNIILYEKKSETN